MRRDGGARYLSNMYQRTLTRAPTSFLRLLAFEHSSNLLAEGSVRTRALQSKFDATRRNFVTVTYDRLRPGARYWSASKRVTCVSIENASAIILFGIICFIYVSDIWDKVRYNSIIKSSNPWMPLFTTFTALSPPPAGKTVYLSTH